MGKNIRAGAHYTQFMVYDLDGDGKAEVVMRTADGTVDGKGKVIGNADADYREAGTFDPSRKLAYSPVSKPPHPANKVLSYRIDKLKRRRKRISVQKHKKTSYSCNLWINDDEY